MNFIGGEIDPLAMAFFLILAFMMSGSIHVIWLKSSVSSSFAIPLDGGRSFAGQRLFGDNKTVRGLIALPPATGTAFWLLAQFHQSIPEWIASGMWNLPAGDYFWLGLWGGLGFMLAELPNSFLKRRMKIAPGEGASGRWSGLFCLILDRIDSILGLLITLSLFAFVPMLTWVYLILFGSLTHWLFSFILYSLKVKSRPL